MQNMLMNRVLLIGLAVAFLISSCGSISSFESPNSLRNMDGTLYLHNGRSYKGRLIIETVSVYGRPVKIYTQDDRRPMQFNLSEVAGYDIKNTKYDLKEVMGGLRLGKQFSFMKRLTPETSRIHLYEYLNKNTDNKKGYAAIKTQYEVDYYLQLPNEEGQAVYPLGGSKFIPGFDEKMSKLVSDCPALAQKIAAKEAGYFYAQISLLKQKKADVLMNIIQEYNRCR